MNARTPIIAELDADLLAKVDRLARAAGVSQSQFAVEALGRYVEAEIAFADSLDQAGRQIDRGEFLTHEEMTADIAQWRQDRRRPA